MNQPQPANEPLDEGWPEQAPDPTPPAQGPLSGLRQWQRQQQRKRRTREALLHILQSAMRLLDFNGIDSDYVEFGCFRAETLPLAHRINRMLPI